MEQKYPSPEDEQWQVYRDEHGKVVSNVPYDWYLPTLRFPCAQLGKDNTSLDFRPIDDCSASGLIGSTHTSEHLKMHGLSTLLACGHMVRKMFSSWVAEGEAIFSKGDHEKSYRQWLASPEDCALLITLVWSDMVGPSGGFEAYAHWALPFGALAAVII